MRATLSAYCLERDLGPRTIHAYRLALDRFERWAGRPVAAEELSDELVNRWLVDLAGEVQPVTVKGYRRVILTLWRAAYDQHRIDYLPGRVRKIRVPRYVPTAWPVEMVSALLAEAGKCQGHFRFHANVSKADFWTAFVMTSWDSCLRLGDVLRIRRPQITPSGLVVLVQSKTGWPVVGRLRPETVAAIDKIAPLSRETVFGILSRRQFYLYFAELVAKTGLSGGSKMIRRSSATAVEREHPGAAQLHLGHRTAGLAWKHYIDPALLDHEHKPLPPKIG